MHSFPANQTLVIFPYTSEESKGVPSLTNAVKGRREGTGRLKLVGVKMTEGVCHMYFDACRNYTISHFTRDF